jgi:hypothetical protein
MKSGREVEVREVRCVYCERKKEQIKRRGVVVLAVN